MLRLKKDIDLLRPYVEEEEEEGEEEEEEEEEEKRLVKKKDKKNIFIEFSRAQYAGGITM